MARKCPQCGSRKWRKDAISGSVVCEEGHVLSGIRSENLVAEANGHALQKRRTTKGPRVNKRKTEGQASKDFYHGQAAEYLRIQGLQLMLRHQVAALKALWSLPDALEIVVRDLWAYHLLMAPIPQLDQDGGRSSSPSPPPEAGPSQVRFEDEKKNTSDSGSATDTSSKEDESDQDSSSDESEDSDKDGQVDEELIAKLSDEGESDDETANKIDVDGPAPVQQRRRRKIHVSDTLVCLILALWVLRVPFTHAEIQSFVNTNRIPYIDFAKSTLISPEMAKHMNHDVQISLRPTRSPSPLYLFKRTRKFARILTRTYGLSFPEINVQPVAWKVISQLGGTAITHAQALAFLELIDANMTLNDTESAPVVRKRRNSESATTTSERTRRYLDVVMPELSFAAAWVVVMKMAYGLDGRERFALLQTDPLVGMPQGGQWVDELEKRVESGVLKGTQSELERQRFDLMAGEDMDRFLDRCEEVLLKDRDVGTGQFLSQFPLLPVTPTPPKEPPPNSWADFHESVDPVRIAKPSVATGNNRELPLMAGESYKSYDAKDITGTLPESLETVLQAAADVVGVTQQQVAQIVEVFEGRMEKRRPRREYHALPLREHAASPAFRRVRASGGLRESRSLDKGLSEYR